MTDKLLNKDDKSQQSDPVKNKNKNRFLKLFLRTFLILFTGFLILLVVLFIFVQTETFNKIVLTYTLREINDSWKTKESTLYAESIEGNILTGVKVLNGNIVVKGDTLMRFSSIDVKYSIWGFLHREIRLNEAVLNDPEINITNVKGFGDNLMWNINYLFTSKEQKIDTSAFDWAVTIKNLKIHNGMVRIVGMRPPGVYFRKIEMPHLTYFDINNLDLFNLETELEAEYLADSKVLILKSLSFNTNSDFKLNAMSFEARITNVDTVTQLRNLVFKTDRSELYADNIFMNKLNPFRRVLYEDFGNDNVKIVLNTPRFNFKDLKFFFPQVNFLDSTISLDLEAEGRYSNLTFNKLVLNTPNSHIDLKGRIEHLDEPSKLYLDMTANDLVIDPRDAKLIAPGLPIPDYSQVGKVYASFKYTGEPLNFNTDFDVRSDNAGSARGNLSFDLNAPNYSYRGNFETSSLNIGRIIKNKDLEGTLNMRANVTGSGFDFNTLSSRVNYEISGSRIYGINISRSSGILNIRNRNIDGELTFISGSMQSSAKGSINVSDFSNPKYSLKGAVRNLNLADFTRSSEDKSNLNFTFDVNGRGMSLNNIDGTYNLVLSNSYYSTYHIPSTPVNLKISNSKTNGSIDLVTNLFDFKAKGRFNLAEIASAISYNISVIENEFARNLKYDSLSTASNITYPKKNLSDFDFQYEFITKDTKAFSEMFEKPGYEFSGKLSGRLQNSQDEFSSATGIDIRNLFFQDTLLQVKRLSGTATLKNDYQKTIPSDKTEFYALSSDIRLNGDSLQIGNFRLDTVYINMNLADAVDNFRLFGRKDTTYTVFSNGNVQFEKELILLNTDSVFARYHEYDVHNEGPLTVSYNPDPAQQTFNFEHFNVSDSIMKLNLEGKFSLKQSSDLNLNAKNLRVAEIIEYLYPNAPDEPHYISPVRGNVRRLSVKYEGTFDDPVLNLEMNSDLLRYETNSIGRIDAFIDYKNAVLNSDVLVSSAQGNGKLRITGDIPFENPFLSKETASYTSVEHYPVDFKLKATDFQVNFFSKVIPNFTDINGILNGEITAKGTVSEPVLLGYMNVTKGSFLLPLTGLNYSFNSNLKTENSNILVENFRIFNANDNTRHIDVSGKINFEGLKINDIDLRGTGNITVIDPSVDYNELGIYGTVVAGTGIPPLTLKGDLEDLMLAGQILIKDADISEITFQGPSTYDLYSDNFVYRVMSDTLSKNIVYVTPEKYYDTNPFQRSRLRIAPKYLTKTTNLDMNINIKTLNNLILSVELGNVPKQELVGELNADVNIITDKLHQVRAFGSVDIVGDSYYRFYRNFKVTKSGIKFVGPPDNPELNFHASYEFNSGTTTGSNVQILLDVTGTANKPEISMRLFENGNEVSGQDAQADAISYLLFGVPKSQLLESQRSSLVKNIGATTGTSYLSSALSGALRNIAPFILNTELTYTEGNILQGTDIRITSAFGDAIVKVGGRIFSDLNNTEISVQYPLSKLLGSLGNNLLLEISRTADFNSTISADIRTISTGVKLLYIFKY